MNEIELRAYELFYEALKLPEQLRGGWMATREDAGPEVLACAIKMLRAYEANTAGVLEDILPHWQPEWEGTTVNGWRIDRNLGQGGFGSVYHASRSAPGGEEEAAIKFLDMAPHAIPRFERERRTLASLDHEGICKFIDGGTTDDGVPYMVMEYVPGLPLTRHCDHHQMTVTGRLKLFVKLCQAVEYGHNHRVLHRDLKPANILVTVRGDVRVLDFGVAKLLAGHDGAQALTRQDDAPWTKAYASPEQIDGRELSFATDVYALGVLLYELVTGQLPHSEFALSGADWKNVIRKREPLPPSQALLVEKSGEPGSHISETAAASRRASPSRLRRVLMGDLDAVILKALRKDPGQRYQRVEGLRLEVEHFLEGLPVSARRSPWWERAARWSSRNPLAAAGTLVWTVIVATVLHIASLGDLRYHRQRRERDMAIQRLRYLAEVGMPGIERALPPDAGNMAVRWQLVQTHARLLDGMESLPPYSLTMLDGSLGVSAVACGRLYMDLGDPTAALAITAPVLPRIARHYDLDHRDKRWREIYSDLLRQRVSIRRMLGEDAGVSEEARRLAQIEATSAR